MKRLWLMVLLLPFSVQAASITLSRLLDSEIKLERKLLDGDIAALNSTYRSWNKSIGRVTELQDNLLQATRAEHVSAANIDDLVQQVAAEMALSMAYQNQIQILNERILNRQQRIEVMDDERGISQAQEEAEDPLSGDWEVTVSPPDMTGKFTLSLSGTLISGTYQLSGGWKGSLKGTLVGSRVRLERIDTEQGFMAVYYGKVDRENLTIQGTWESTLFTTGGPMTGNWTARRVRDQH
jgi:hypothetical protein